MICHKCHIEYDEGKKFCRNCGSPLSATEKSSTTLGTDPSLVERTRIVRVCPKCQLHFEVGNYCRVCGFFLEKKKVSQGSERIPDKKLIKSLSSEWLRLSKRRSELETCLENLERHRDGLSEETFNPIFQRYQVQVESLSSRLRETEAEIESFRTKVSEKIAFLDEESSSIHKRFEEIRSLHQSGAITRTDYFTVKDGMEKEKKDIERRLKEYRTTMSTLSAPLGRRSLFPLKAANLLQYRFLAIVGGIIILIVLGTYFLWTRNFKASNFEGSSKMSQAEPSVLASPPTSSPEFQDDDKIKSLFGKIRQANLEKRIDLFMSCYAADFKDRNGKKSETLETWHNFDYLDLSYDLKRMTVTGQTAQVRVEWQISISPKNGGTPHKAASLLDVTLKKEEGDWKIGEIRPVS
jgi:prefoldin subunit 5/RNA polymerase subunit RPABC4/transcription elongation factor Spt4